MISESHDRTAEAMIEIFHCLTSASGAWKFLAGSATLMKIACYEYIFV
jgi:hypothetical protein